MERQDERHDDEETLPQAKRTGRDAANPRSQPGEFLNDMEVNRSGTPGPEEQETKD